MPEASIFEKAFRAELLAAQRFIDAEPACLRRHDELGLDDSFARR